MGDQDDKDVAIRAPYVQEILELKAKLEAFDMDTKLVMQNNTLRQQNFKLSVESQTILDYCRTLEAEIATLKSVSLEPIAYYDPTDEDETEAFLFPDLYKAHVQAGSFVGRYVKLFTAEQINKMATKEA